MPRAVRPGSRRRDAAGPARSTASTVNDPPAPPAPFTFQPSTSGPRTASIDDVGFGAHERRHAAAPGSRCCASARRHRSSRSPSDERGGAVVRTGAQRLEARIAGTRMLQRLDDLSVHGRRVVPWASSTTSNCASSAAVVSGEAPAACAGRGIARHLDQRCTSGGRRPLILDAALLSRRSVSTRWARAPATLDRVSAPRRRSRAASTATHTLADVPMDAPGGTAEPTSSSQAPVWHFRLIQAGADQRVRADLRRSARRPMPFTVEVAQAYLDTGRPVVRADAHVHSGPHREVTDRAVSGKPRVGPAAEIGDAGGGGDGDGGHRDVQNCRLSEFHHHLMFHGAAGCHPEILKF